MKYNHGIGSDLLDINHPQWCAAPGYGRPLGAEWRLSIEILVPLKWHMASYGVVVGPEAAVEAERTGPEIVINAQSDQGGSPAVPTQSPDSPSPGVMEYMTNMLNNNPLPGPVTGLIGEAGETASGRVTPPPSYDETIKSAVPLAFIDFWPRCLQFSDEDFLRSPFESFDHVVQEANKWLSAQNRIVLRNCETVEIKVTSLDEYIDMYTVTKTRTPKTQYRIPVYVKGFRVWYSSKILNKLPCGFGRTPCKLAYVNIRPSCSDGQNGYGYENFPSLIEKCNNLINCGVISGRILNAETVRIKESNFEDASILNMSANPDRCVWKDSYYKVALTFLRVFFLPDAPVREELHYRDFVPQCLRRSNSHPKFVDFQAIMNDCQLWLLQLGADFRLLNAQTVEGKCSSQAASFIDSSATFHADYESTPRVRFLRIYYAKPDGALSQNYLAPLISYRTFVPNISGRRRHHETLAMLMRRVESWLRSTGASAVCAETLIIPDYHAKSTIHADGSVFRSEYVEGGSEFDQETLVYIIKIYLDSVYPEPNCDHFGDDEDCVLL